MASTTAHSNTAGRKSRGAALALTSLLALCMSPVAVQAASSVAVSVCDEAHLRSAIATAGAGGKVTFSCSGTIGLATTLTFGSSASGLTIDGTGQSVTISGGHVVEVFAVDPGVTLALVHLSVANGNGPFGGGIFNAGSLTVTDTAFTGNTAPECCGNGGGAIFNAGTLHVSSSTFTGNDAPGGGGILNNGAATVSNTTFSNNTAGLAGAAVQNNGPLDISGSTFVGGRTSNAGGGINGGGLLHVTNSTFVDNSAFAGGGGHGGAINGAISGSSVTNTTLSGNGSDTGGGMNLNSGVRVTNTIVARSTAGGNCSGEPVDDGGGNLDDGTTCGFSTANHDRSNVDPQLLALAANGGPTQTMALAATSPAIGLGIASACLSTAATSPVDNVDQRGDPRHADTRGVCDSGAFDTAGGNNAILLSCELTAHRIGPPAQIDVTVQAAGKGLKSVQVTQSSNATFKMNPAAFAPGSTGPVVVTFTKINQSQAAVVALRVTDMAGNAITCDPIETLVATAHGAARQTFYGVPRAEHFVLLSNSDPGLRQLIVLVNGHPFTERALRGGEQLSLDVDAAMRPGDSNTIVLVGIGKRSSRAEVLISDQP